MRRARLLVLAVAALLCACAIEPTVSRDQKDIVEVTVIVECTVLVTQPPLPTYTPYPTCTILPTLTRAPLSAQDLVPLLVQPGDLPDGRTAGQVRDLIPSKWIAKGVPAPDSQLFLELVGGTDSNGGMIYVLLYEDAKDAVTAFNADLADARQFATENEKKAPEEVPYGHQAYVWAMAWPWLNPPSSRVEALFRRCGAVVYFHFSGTLSKDSTLAYMARLDRRLAEVVCH